LTRGTVGVSSAGVLLGIALGVLIGLVSGAVFELLWDAGHNSSDVGGAVKVASALLAIPTTWFGGGWLAGSAILKDVDVAKIRSAYVVTLAVVFAAFVLWNVLRRQSAAPAATPPVHDA
jgi:hypothetical protein